MINRAFSEEARATWHRMPQQDVRSNRRGRCRIGRPEDRHHRHADGCSDVHRPGIIGDEYGAPFEHRSKHLDIRTTCQVNDALRPARTRLNDPRH